MLMVKMMMNTCLNVNISMKMMMVSWKNSYSYYSIETMLNIVVDRFGRWWTTMKDDDYDDGNRRLSSKSSFSLVSILLSFDLFTDSSNVEVVGRRTVDEIRYQ